MGWKSLLKFVFLCIFSISSIQCELKTNFKNKLDAPASIQRAIHGMTAAGLSHEHIHKNIQAHFPDKKPNEINDIIVLSNAQKKKHAKKYNSKKK